MAEVDDPSPVTEKTKKKINILMVDDQPAKLLSYEAILSELGENLIRANSGKEALEQLLKTEVAVVLLDVSMPELNGFDVAKIIRQHPRFERTAIIFISAAHLSDADRLEGYRRGAVDYISVPVIPEILRAKISVFVELHRRSQQLRELNEELRLLSNHLLVAQDAERRRIARELHDGLGQELAVAKMSLDTILEDTVLAERSTQSKKLVIEAAATINRAIQQVRSISHLLHPPLLDEVGLVSAVRWYLDGLTQRSGIETSFDPLPVDFPRLAADLETAIFRIIQESLTNVFRHSGAHRVWVVLAQQAGKAIITVRDDGKGVEKRITQFQPGSIGVGIGGMRQRVKELGGLLRVANAHPGTLVEVVIPLGDHCSTGAQVAIPSPKYEGQPRSRARVVTPAIASP